MKKLEVIYEHGVLKPLELEEGQHVTMTIEPQLALSSRDRHSQLQSRLYFPPVTIRQVANDPNTCFGHCYQKHAERRGMT